MATPTADAKMTRETIEETNRLLRELITLTEALPDRIAAAVQAGVAQTAVTTLHALDKRRRRRGTGLPRTESGPTAEKG